MAYDVARRATRPPTSHAAASAATATAVVFDCRTSAPTKRSAYVARKTGGTAGNSRTLDGASLSLARCRKNKNTIKPSVIKIDVNASAPTSSNNPNPARPTGNPPTLGNP